MIILAQVGNVPIIQLNPKDRWGNNSLQNGSKVAEIDGAIDIAAGNSQFITQNRRIQIDAIIPAGNEQGAKRFAQLRGITGHVVNLVGYALYECEAIWLETTGRISAVTGKPSVEGDIEASFDLELGNVWLPLNRLLWKYPYAGISTLLNQPTPPNPLSPDRPNLFPLAGGLEQVPVSTLDSTFQIGYSDVYASARNASPYYHVNCGVTSSSGIEVGNRVYASPTDIDYIETIPGQQYTLSIWIRGISNYSGETCRVNIFDSTRTLIGSSSDQVFNAFGDWERRNFTFTAVDNYISVSIRRVLSTAATVFYAGGFALITGATAFYDYAIPSADSYPAIESGITQYPTLQQWLDSIRNYCWQRIKFEQSLMLDPNAWGLVIQGLPDYYPVIGLHFDWSSPTSYIGINFGNGQGFWNVDPVGIAAYRHLLSNSATNLNLSGAYGKSQSIVLNTTIIDTILRSETGLPLLDTDYVLVGGFNGRAAVVRNGRIVAYCARAIQKQNMYVEPMRINLKNQTLITENIFDLFEYDWKMLFLGVMA